jgi:hypothetical protein
MPKPQRKDVLTLLADLCAQNERIEQNQRSIMAQQRALQARMGTLFVPATTAPVTRKRGAGPYRERLAAASREALKSPAVEGGATDDSTGE